MADMPRGDPQVPSVIHAKGEVGFVLRGARFERDPSITLQN